MYVMAIIDSIVHRGQISNFRSVLDAVFVGALRKPPHPNLFMTCVLLILIVHRGQISCSRSVLDAGEVSLTYYSGALPIHRIGDPEQLRSGLDFWIVRIVSLQLTVIFCYKAVHYDLSGKCAILSRVKAVRVHLIRFAFAQHLPFTREGSVTECFRIT